jgi:circadian clock protein KaiC
MMTHQLTRVSTGVDGFDTILGGGLVEGASYIVQGQPGAGKTILSNQIAFAHAASGGRVLYITLLAETHDRLFQSLGTLDYFDKERLGNGISYVSVFQTLRSDGLAAVVDLLRKETKRQNATLLVFDGLLNARDRAETELDVKTFVAEVQSQAAFVGCTVLFLTSAQIGENSPEHTMVDGVIELQDELVGVRAIRRLRVRKSRGSAALGGFHQYEITGRGIALYPRIEAALDTPTRADEDPDPVPLTSGIEGLDRLTGGGLPRGSTTLLIGPSGSGKTSFGLNFLSEASTEEPALYFGFYETPSRMRLKARSLGLGFDDLIESGALELLWNPLTENMLDKLGYQLLDAVARRGVKRLVVDSFGGFERAAAHRARLVEFFAALTNELRAQGVTTVGTWEMRDLFGADVTAPGPEISSLLDNLILLRQVEYRSRFLRVLSVLKIRNGAYDAVPHEVVIDGHGLAVEKPFEAAAGITTGIARPLDA